MAARLLTRPGEAIYNDANGLYEGNHPFQVAWLSDTQRDDCLQRVRRLAQQRQVEVPPAIVFEGNVLADPMQNAPLCELIGAGSWPDPSHVAPSTVVNGSPSCARLLFPPNRTAIGSQH